MAASMASKLFRAGARSTIRKVSLFSNGLLQKGPRRNYDRHRMRYLKEMYQKRLDAGPEKPRRRSEWINWNYDAEIYAFGQRLGEEFEESTLRQAFINRSYVEGEKKKRAELGIDIDAVPLQLDDNTEFANEGSVLMSSYLKVYLRNIYPYMFEEGISAAHDYLTTDEMLAHISKHIGCEDLILSEEFPTSSATLSTTFKAVVGALFSDKGRERAEQFVRDFVLPQLIETDINELWQIVNPMGLLKAVLVLSGKGEPEPRLLWKSGANTIMSLYWVGIYSDKDFIAKSPGETILIAEEMAAREAIKKIMKTEDSRAPLVLGAAAENLKLDYERVNVSAEDIIRKYYGSEDPQKNTSTSL
ncbi:39S ribosomal protein l44, mitochondrial-like protein [Plakobranchus ocellatus]|uniref:Large ribosomal subunit protein mL44 n=1 Tax=Plakobranchus ocellatus TaxID=259542 RepID=A0AAV4DES1_9GAST|nr:39S ribosomal protein l44, mitochondrial-like protein [Plakobranchus ocellatus]